jgi:hypothetical protein
VYLLVKGAQELPTKTSGSPCKVQENESRSSKWAFKNLKETFAHDAQQFWCHP